MTPGPSARTISSRIVLGMLPWSLFVVLDYLRPDLMQPMLDHIVGRAFALTVTALTLGGTAVQLYAAFRPRGWRIGLTIGGALLCISPAIFIVMFGPILFAFMFGNVEAP